MLRDGQRFCDICEVKIPKGENYVASTVPKSQAHLFRETMEANPEVGVKTTPDSQGNLRLNVCLDCHMNMDPPGTPTVH
jgi:hypothetical protein